MQSNNNYGRTKSKTAYGMGSNGNKVGEEEKPKVGIKERITRITDTATAARLRIAKKNYFESGKRGELFEWKQDLNSENELVKKEAVKKIIASMTIGKDIGTLFPHMLKCLFTKDMELKKLVYHYLIHYSSSNPELAVLAINTFCKDCEDGNATIRALALRTMAMIRVDCIAEYLTDPLRKLMKDEHPFVRKTAVIAVAKFFETMPEVAADFEFDVELNKMLAFEINSSVVGAIISALADIWSTVGRRFEIPESITLKIIRHLPECNEWSQIAIFEALTKHYKLPQGAEGTKVLMAAVPFLQHQNEALVLVTCKFLLLNLPQGEENYYFGKISPSLVSLLSAGKEKEMEFVVLKNLQEFARLVPLPSLLRSKNFRLLVPKYTESASIKREKLKLLPKLLNEDNFDAVIVELAEEAKMEVDPEVVTCSVRALVECALQLNGMAAPLVIGALSGLVRTGVVPALWMAARELVIRFGIVEELQQLIVLLVDELDSEQVAIWSENAVSAMLWIVGECSGVFGTDPGILDSPTVLEFDSLKVQNKLVSARIKVGKEPPVGMDRDMRDRIKFLGAHNFESSAAAARQLLKQRLEEEKAMNRGQKLILGNASSILEVQPDISERVQVLKSEELSLETLELGEEEEDYAEAMSDDDMDGVYDDSLNDSESIN